MAWTQDKVNETYLEVQKLASSDAAFRAEMLDNPNAAIEKVAGQPLPEGYSVKVIESDPAYSATFVLPAMVSGELSDIELESIAGGDNNNVNSKS